MAIQELQSRLNHSDPNIRNETLKSLLEMANHEAYGLLMYTASNHFSPETRRSARKASLLLQKTLFSDGGQTAKSQEAEVQSSILKNFQNSDSAAKLSTLKQVVESKNREVFNELINLLHKEPDPEILPDLIMTCSQLDPIQSIPHITNFLRSGNPKIRVSVIRAVAAADASANHALLVRFTRDPDQDVRQESLKAVSSLEAQSLLSCLLDMATKNSDFHRDVVIFVIARLAFKPGFELLIQLSQDSSEVIQQRAKMALEYLEKKGILTPKSELLDATKNTQEQPTIDAATSLTSTKSSPPNLLTSDELEEQLGSTDSQQDQVELDQFRIVRQGEESSAIKAIFHLIEKGRLDNLDELKESVNERNSKKLTATFIMALAQSKDKLHRDYLLECLSYPDARVQANAIEALRMLGCDDVKTRILSFISDNVHDRARANAIIFLHPTGIIDTQQELQNMLNSKSDNRKLSAIFAIMDLFDPQFIQLLEGPIDSPNPVVTRRAIEALKLFVLDKQKPAMLLAEKWKIMNEIISEDTQTELDSESSEEHVDELSMDQIVSSLDEEPKAKSAASKPSIESTEKTPINAPESDGGFSKIKSFMKRLLKK